MKRPIQVPEGSVFTVSFMGIGHGVLSVVDGKGWNNVQIDSDEWAFYETSILVQDGCIDVVASEDIGVSNCVWVCSELDNDS